MDIKLNVKDKSLYYFFSENLIGFRQDERHQMREDENPYYFMKDEIFIKKTGGLKLGESIRFELSDKSANSKKELKNTYIYTVESYDDLAVKLVLSDFKIETI